MKNVLSGESLLHSKSLKSNYFLFFCSGSVVSPWAAVAPVIKDAFAMGAEIFAAMSMCFGFGALSAMFFTGRIIKRWGFKRCAWGSFVMVILSMIMLSSRFMPFEMVYISALLWGGALGIYEVSINIHATYFEELTKRRLLTRFTASYTAGCIAATIIYPLFMHMGFPIELIALGSGLASFTLFLAVFRHTVDTHGQKSECAASQSSLEHTDEKNVYSISEPLQDQKPGGFGLGRLMLLCAAGVTFFSLLAEGTVYDWGGVYLVHECAFPISLAALGFMCYEGCAGVVRFFGEGIVAKIGVVRTVVGGAFLAFTALLLGGLVSYAPIVLLSFALLGTAVGNVMPVIISETARRCLKDKAQAIGFVSAMGYAGILTGPALLGGVAVMYDHAAIFVTVAFGMLIMGLMGYLFLRSEKPRV